MIQLKRHANKRQALLVLVFAFVFTNLLGILGVLNPPVAKAVDITEAQKQECYTRFNNQEIIVSRLSIADQTLFNTYCYGSTFCKFAGPGAESGSQKVTCTNPSAPTEADRKRAEDAEVAPLVKLACGTAPPGETAQARFLVCGQKVRAIYLECSKTGGGVTGSGTDTPENTARCAVPKINAVPEANNITVNAAIVAIRDGRGDADAIINAAALAKVKKACEEQGGTFANGKCTPKADDEKTCSGGALGWVICPVISAIGGVNDAIFYMIEQQLFINPVSVQYDGPLYKIWTTFRDIANFAFVIAFIAVIYSQATGAGLSSYGVKKMLPRIIVTAILVNISFFLCQIALDFSNIIGKSLGDLMESVLNGANINVDIISWDSLIAGLIAGGAVFGVGAAVVGAGGVAAAAALLLPFAITAMFAALTAIVVLIARQAIIILLIAIAPLAFVAYLLPNTAKYFERWRELFVTMLILYPLVAVLFAGSKLASWILLNAGSNGAEVSPLMLLTAIMILFLPLFGVPLLLKFSGGLLGRIGAFVNNPNKGPFDALKKRATQKSDTLAARAASRNLSKERPDFSNKRFGRTRKALYGITAAGVAKSAVDRERDLNEAKKFQERAATGYYAGRVTTDDDYANRMAGGTRLHDAKLADIAKVRGPAIQALINQNSEEQQAHALNLNRNGATLAAHGITLDDRDTFRDRAGTVITSLQAANASGLQSTGGNFDVETRAALKYATQNALPTTSNGAKALATTLANTGNLTSETARNLVDMPTGLSAEDRGYIASHINEVAGKAGLKHLSYNTVDVNGNFELGGQFGGVGGVTNRLMQNGVSTITKEMYADSTFGPELAHAVTNLETASPETFQSELVKMDPRKIENMVAAKVAAGIIPAASQAIAVQSYTQERADAVEKYGIAA